MNHDRLMRLAVFAGIGQFKSLRIVEIHLHRGALPGPAQDILDLDIDFWAIEDAFAGIDLIGHPAFLECGFQCTRGLRPALF